MARERVFSVADKIKAINDFKVQVGNTLSEEELQMLSDEVEKLQNSEGGIGEGGFGPRKFTSVNPEGEQIV